MTPSSSTGSRAKASAARTDSIRVAIYTRKSVSEGLDQAFNTLDAQREAVEAFVQSQRGQGWVALAEHYDDGGYTGANTDRPAFQRLLDDIEAGRVDVVAVYKIDRLSRSLLDFAQLMNMFQAKRVAFVSVTETFDTSTPMGRMVLNLLATFAQFERETTAQRTRDKMQASRRRGMWTGGRPVLGYDVVDNRLVVNEPEAEQVRDVFKLYLELGSLLAVVKELAARGWTTKSWINQSNKPVEGRPFTKTSLHGLLTNPLYLGRVRAGDEVVDGQHDAIVDEQTWESVQALLHANSNCSTRPVAVRGSKSGALLQGLARCRCGAALAPHYSTKGNRRYAYYVCARHQKQGAASCPGSRVAAGKLEEFVLEQIRSVGRDPKLLEATIAAEHEARDVRKPGLEAEAKLLRVEKARIERERENIAEVVAREGAGGDVFTRKLGKLDEEFGDAAVRHEQVTTDLAGLDAAVVDAEELRVALEDLEPLWDELFPGERARLFALLIETVMFDAQAGALEITFRPGGPRAVRQTGASA